MQVREARQEGGGERGGTPWGTTVTTQHAAHKPHPRRYSTGRHILSGMVTGPAATMIPNPTCPGFNNDSDPYFIDSYFLH